MDIFKFDDVTAVLMADGWHRPEPGSLRWRTATRWIDGDPAPMVEWLEKGSAVFAPAPNVLAVQSAAPSPEPPQVAPRDPLAELLEGAGRASFDSDAAARGNGGLFAGRPGA